MWLCSHTLNTLLLFSLLYYWILLCHKVTKCIETALKVWMEAVGIEADCFCRGLKDFGKDISSTLLLVKQVNRVSLFTRNKTGMWLHHEQRFLFNSSLKKLSYFSNRSYSSLNFECKKLVSYLRNVWKPFPLKLSLNVSC